MFWRLGNFSQTWKNCWIWEFWDLSTHPCLSTTSLQYVACFILVFHHSCPLLISSSLGCDLENKWNTIFFSSTVSWPFALLSAPLPLSFEIYLSFNLSPPPQSNFFHFIFHAFDFQSLISAFLIQSLLILQELPISYLSLVIRSWLKNELHLFTSFIYQ